MFRFIAYRLAQFPLILAVIYLLTFILAWVVPGSPFERNDRKLSVQALQRQQEEMHAEHWYTFLGHYPARVVLHGDFGPSLSYDGWTVNDILHDALPVSISLGLLALIIAICCGVGIGAMAAVDKGKALDWLSLSIALIGISLPSFVVASLLLTVFAFYLHVFPVGRWEHISDVVLPAVALSLMPMAYIARLTRVAMIDVLSNDYVRTARAKGLSRRSVLWKHCLGNALLPVLSYLGPAAAATLTGSFVVEKVFNVPGLGQHFVNSVLNRDQTMILGTVMVYSVFLMSLNLLVDVGYALVDPRIDLGARQET